MSFLKSIFGGDAPKISYTPGGFSGGGLSASYGPNGYDLSTSPERAGLVSNISNVYGNQAGDIADLRSTVAPGFNQLLQSRIANINDSATKAVGDLRQNLASRRILGSSFGNDTLTRANSEFSRQRDAAISDNFLQSLDANSKLLQQQYTAQRGAYETGLNELNLEADTANKLTQGANSVLGSIASKQAELESAAQGRMSSSIGSLVGTLGGSLFGPAGSAIGGALGSRVSGLFSGGSSPMSLAPNSGLGGLY
jgi:hypothetical protein